MDNQEFKEAIKLARQDAWNKAIRKAAEVAEMSSIFGSPQVADEILLLIKRTPRSKRRK